MIKNNFAQVAVVIPSYRVVKHILGVISEIGPEVWRIYVVDDKCPDESGQYVVNNCKDARVVVLWHDMNQGVGGAVMSGYRAAISDGAEIIIKVDGDGQMDPCLIPILIEPILAGDADYTKGNRFFNLEEIKTMPKARLFGNAVLSFMTKLSSGYWDIFDPTNGYTAIHAGVARHLPFGKISHSYFFETDMLFRLNTLRAVVVDVPMSARYGDEISHLKISKIISEFLLKHCRNFVKRIFYNYYLRDMSVASIELPVGLFLTIFGFFFGVYHWIHSIRESLTTPSGTVMLAALPILVGGQFLLSFLGADISNVPRRSLNKSYQLSNKYNIVSKVQNEK
jgi:dolichol-phosphate mannosyltransferase